jgi:hypothetical protein
VIEMKRLLFALLCASTALAVPHSSHAQAVKGMTLDQYLLMQERVDAFCSFYADQVAGAKPWPSYSAGVRIRAVPGTTLDYVYSPTEVQALMKHCRNLIRLMQQVRQ